MAINDATSLVSELFDKLSQLEQKVETHRQDMASEFQRYSRDLLQHVPGDVSTKVEKLIRDSMHNYPALVPALDHDNPIRNESPKRHKGHMDNEDSKPITSHDARQRHGKTSPPPLLPHTSGTPPDTHDGPRSPHEREREFHGLFTPDFLPLLEDRDNRNKKPSPAPTLPPALPPSSDQTEKLTKAPAKVDQPPSPPITILRPVPVRRPTEDTISSANSDDSAGKQRRRSALRRSSSSSTKPHSPRRVRFEVEGGEVLPTVSPPLSPRIIEHTQSLLSNSINLLNSPYDSEPIEIEEDEGLLGSSPPSLTKKVSSTDRLKALARNSHEDTSKWNMVGNFQDMDEDEEVLVMGGRKKTKTAAQLATPNSGAPGLPVTPEDSSGTIDHVEHVENVEHIQADDLEPGSYEDANDDLFEMPALTSFKTRKRFSPPRTDISPVDDFKAHQGTPTPTKPVQIEPQFSLGSSTSAVPAEDDALFDWDPDEGEEDGPRTLKGDNNSNLPPKYLEETDDDDEDEADVDDDGSTARNTSHNSGEISTLSTSPGVPISRPAPAAASLPSRHAIEAVGSYNGRPFTISSVKDQSILEKAAMMGDMYSFVGSVDGRSGVDASTSYRPDASTFTGTPRSLSQRLAMEEYAESRRQSPTSGKP